MASGIATPFEVSYGHGVDPIVMRGLHRAPRVLSQLLRHGGQG